MKRFFSRKGKQEDEYEEGTEEGSAEETSDEESEETSSEESSSSDEESSDDDGESSVASKESDDDAKAPVPAAAPAAAASRRVTKTTTTQQAAAFQTPQKQTVTKSFSLGGSSGKARISDSAAPSPEVSKKVSSPLLVADSSLAHSPGSITPKRSSSGPFRLMTAERAESWEKRRPLPLPTDEKEYLEVQAGAEHLAVTLSEAEKRLKRILNF